MASIVAAWPTVALGEVLTPISRPVRVNPSEIYPLLGMHWYAEGLYIKDRKAGTQIQADTLYQVRAGDFVYNRLFAWKGSFGLADGAVDRCYVSNEFPCFAIDETRLLPGFLRWYFAQSAVWESVEAQSSGSTPTSRLRLKEPELLAMELPLPPVDEQRRIVARIEELAARIEEARGLRREAAELVGALLRSAMRDAFDPNRSRDATTLEAACVAIIDNLHSNPVYAEIGIPCVRSPDVGWGTLDLAHALRTSEEEFRRRTVRGEPKRGDIVLVREGGGTGKAAIVEEGQRFSLGQRVMMIRTNCEVVVPKYFLYQLLSPAVYDEQIAPMSKGSASPHLNIGALRKFRFQLPPMNEQMRVVAHMDELYAWKGELERLQAEVAAELDALLPSVLDQAFRGEL